MNESSPASSEGFPSSSRSERLRSVPSAHPYAEVRIVALSELAGTGQTWSEGHAHLGFDGIPLGAPGKLDFPPLKLAAMETIQPGAGYAMHQHKELESMAFVLDGSVLHEDSSGGRVELGESEFSLLSAGTGASHAEFAGPASPARVVVFALTPSELGTAPRAFHRHFPKSERVERWATLASGRPNAPETALPMRRDASVLAAALGAGGVVRHRLAGTRRAYLLTTDAAVSVNGKRAEAGERALVSGPGMIEICAFGATQVLLLDVD